MKSWLWATLGASVLAIGFWSGPASAAPRQSTLAEVLEEGVRVSCWLSKETRPIDCRIHPDTQGLTPEIQLAVLERAERTEARWIEGLAPGDRLFMDIGRESQWAVTTDTSSRAGQSRLLRGADGAPSTADHRIRCAVDAAGINRNCEVVEPSGVPSRRAANITRVYEGRPAGGSVVDGFSYVESKGGPPRVFEAAAPGDRVEYTGPPVVVQGPPPPAQRDETRLVAGPDWIKKPTMADLERFYPPRALAAEIGGRAIIECSVTGQGTLTDCVAISETPAGMGFGEATVQIAAKYQMRPRTADGRTVEGARIRLPITWKLDAPVEETSPPDQ